MIKKIIIIVASNAEEAKEFVSNGFCPIECSFGLESIIDDLNMDHHGVWSHLEPVSIRAYRDLFGKRKDDPRFVLASADLDATFAAMALAGLLPHPDRNVSNTPDFLKTGLTKDLSALAETIARIDMNPIGLNIPSLPYGDIVLTWQAMCQNNRDTLGAMGGAAVLRTLTEGNPNQLRAFLAAAQAAEEGRVKCSIEDLTERGVIIDGVLVIKESRTFGFSEWYGKRYGRGIEDISAEDPDGWTHPIVLAWVGRGHNVTIGCPNDAVAEHLFGRGGLKNVFPKLYPVGWGGRESVGGSARGIEISWEQVVEAAKTVAASIKQRKCPQCGTGMCSTPYPEPEDPEGKNGYILHIFCSQCGTEENKYIKR